MTRGFADLPSEILLHHYGQQIIGRTTAPSTEDFALRAFEKLERSAAGHELLELALAYRLLYDGFYRADDNRIRGLLASSLDLSELDSVRFLMEILVRTRVENWQTVPTPQGKTFERVARSFFEKYGKYIVEIYGVDEQLLSMISVSGVGEDDAKTLAQQFVREGLHKARPSMAIR